MRDDLILKIQIAFLILMLLTLSNVGQLEAQTPLSGNCTSCHNESPASGTAIVNISAMNITGENKSIHLTLNNLSTDPGYQDTTFNWNNRRCWACHGNGSAPASGSTHDTWPNLRPNESHRCYDCHANNTGGINIPPDEGNYSAPTIYAHVPGFVTMNFTILFRTNINTTTQCYLCHNRSVIINNDDDQVTENNTVESNVSHYGTKQFLPQNQTKNCAYCHKNESRIKEWYFNYTNVGRINNWYNQTYEIRHPAKYNKTSDESVFGSVASLSINGSACRFCHNTTGAQSFHATQLQMRTYVHLEYDWEGDDANENPPNGIIESCFACHNGGMGGASSTRKVCEDCHTANVTTGVPNGPYTSGYTLRSDYNESIPLVFNHINLSTAKIRTSNMSQIVPNSRTVSTCLGWDTDSGNGTCHGVSRENATAEYFFFGYGITKENDGSSSLYKMSPYIYNAPIDYLPNTSNCLYCHQDEGTPSISQVNETIRQQWGYPPKFNTSNSSDAMVNATGLGDCYACHTTTGRAPLYFHEPELTIAGGPDCLSCHEKNAPDLGKYGSIPTPDVNASAMNITGSSIHAELNNKTEEPGRLSDLTEGNLSNNYRCWACHSNGSYVRVGMGTNYATPWLCYDCHANNTGGINVTNRTGNYSAPGIFAHVPDSVTTNFASTNRSDINTTAQCWTCHNRSILFNNDTESGYDVSSYYAMNHTAKSNVSHYGTKQLLPSNQTKNCAYCHKNESIIQDWYFNFTNVGLISNWYNQTYEVRHPAKYNKISDNTVFGAIADNSITASPPTNSACRFCHMRNVTYVNQSHFHTKEVRMAYYVHRDYDWEGDNANETLPAQENESCYACHFGGTGPGSPEAGYSRKICEDCHTANVTTGVPNGPYTYNNSDGNPYNPSDPDPDDYVLRSDFNESIPLVFNHIDISTANIRTSNMSQIVPNSRTASTCVGWDPVSGNGTCHGVSWENATAQYFNFGRDINRSTYSGTDYNASPYIYNAPIDYLPNTSNCLYCHHDEGSSSISQVNEIIRQQWGYPPKFNTSDPSDPMFGITSFTCPSCHTTDGEVPLYFHEPELTTAGGPNCIGCHDAGGNYTTTVNVSSMGTSTAMHRYLNNRSGDPGATIGNGWALCMDNSEGCINWNNQRCWACHSNGSQPANGTMGLYQSNPWKCWDCHVVNGTWTGERNSVFSRAPNVTEHIMEQYAPDINTNTSPSAGKNGTCPVCHVNDIGESNGSVTKSRSVLNASLIANVSHYGQNDSLMYNDSVSWVNSTQCFYCHNDTFNGSIWGGAPQIFGDNDGMYQANESKDCWYCHVDNNEQPTNFHSQTLVINITKCELCHFKYKYFNDTQKVKFVNETKYNESVHSNKSRIYCTNCHTNMSFGSARNETHPYQLNGATFLPPESGWKWCEDCHVYQALYPNETQQRHNITDEPQNYQVINKIGDYQGVLEITDCTTCHDATYYNNATATFNRASGKDCRWCHTFPEQIPASPY